MYLLNLYKKSVIRMEESRMVKINNQNFGYEEFHNGEAIYKMVELHDRENTVNFSNAPLSG